MGVVACFLCPCCFIEFCFCLISSGFFCVDLTFFVYYASGSMICCVLYLFLASRGDFCSFICFCFLCKWFNDLLCFVFISCVSRRFLFVYLLLFFFFKPPKKKKKKKKKK